METNTHTIKPRLEPSREPCTNKRSQQLTFLFFVFDDPMEPSILELLVALPVLLLATFASGPTETLTPPGPTETLTEFCWICAVDRPAG